jgi:hypothetical protein
MMRAISALLLCLTLTAGCGRSERSATSTTTTPTPGDSTTTPGTGIAGPGGDSGPPAAHGDTGAVLEPARDAADIENQIRAQMSEMNTAISAGRLAEVPHGAANVRMLVTTLVERGGTLSASDHNRLTAALPEVRATTTRLEEAAKRNDLVATKQQYALLQKQVHGVVSEAPAP